MNFLDGTFTVCFVILFPLCLSFLWEKVLKEENVVVVRKRRNKPSRVLEVVEEGLPNLTIRAFFSVEESRLCDSQRAHRLVTTCSAFLAEGQEDSQSLYVRFVPYEGLEHARDLLHRNPMKARRARKGFFKQLWPFIKANYTPAERKAAYRRIQEILS